MSQELGLAIMFNNYMHDVATALLLASAIAAWLLARGYAEHGSGAGVGEYFLYVYHRLTRLAVGALAWIILGGVPRLWAYREFEWANAAGNEQVHALVAKHVVAFILVGVGAYFWARLRATAKGAREGSGQ
jgi:hypothetical protein